MIDQHLRVTSSEGLDAIHDVIHDCSFDVDEVFYDKKRERLTINFDYEDFSCNSIDAGKRLWKTIPVYEATLIFGNVTHVAIVDTEKVGFYSFNILIYDAEARTVEIKTNVPLEFKVTVKSLDVTVSVSNKVVGEKRSLLWGLSECLGRWVGRR